MIAWLETKALQEDVAADKLYLSNTLGRPAATVDPESVHVQEALLLHKEVGLMEMVTRSVMKALLEMLLVIVRTSRPEITEEFVQRLLAGFAAQDEAERRSRGRGPRVDRGNAWCQGVPGGAERPVNKPA